MIFYLRRFLAYIIDILVVTGIGYSIIQLGTKIGSFANNVWIVLLFLLLAIVFMAIAIIFRDLLFKNAGIGKKICGLCVICLETDKEPIRSLPKWKRIVCRNWSLLIQYIDVFCMLLNHGDRLGDLSFATRVMNKLPKL